VEVAPAQYVVPSESDLAGLPAATSKELVLEAFVPLSTALDLTAFGQAAHYALPDSIPAHRPYRLLLATMRDREVAGIGRMTVRDREHAVVVLAGPEALVITTVARPGDIRAVPDRMAAPAVTIPDRQRALAGQLVDAMTGPYDPAMHGDVRGEALKALVQAKVEGSELVSAIETPSPVLVDLMAALEASVEAARRSRVAAAAPPTGGPGTLKRPRRGRAKAA
jgi:DNA end-binding protein Ku